MTTDPHQEEIDEDDTNSPTKLDNEVKRQLVDEIEKSKLIIGIKPISTKTIEAEAAAITSTLNPNKKKIEISSTKALQSTL